jgi:hypothetical protein
MATGWPMKTTYANGDVYSASDVNDITGTINLLGSSVAYTAGKNVILNSDFRFWQRGTSFSSTTDTYTADRWKVESNRTGSAVSQQTFTPGTAPVTGYEGTYFLRYTCGTSGAYSSLIQRIEDVRTFANTTVTLSYWAKCSTGTITNEPYYFQNFGSGGSSEVQTALATSTITTSWQRFTQSFTIPSISGKTIGTSSYLSLLLIRPSAATSTTIDVWGVQLERGSTATAFQTATGTIQGELAACQRYFTTSYDIGVAPGSNSSNGAISFSPLTTSTYPWFPSTTFKSMMRVAPSVTAYNPVTGSTSQPVRNGNANTNHPMYILNIGCNGFVSYVDNSSISGGNSIYFHYTASAEL